MEKKSVSKSADKGKEKLTKLVRNLLFICNNNLVRSKTAEDVMKKSKKYNVKSAGLSHWADVPITHQAIKWADVIFVMDENFEMQKSRLLQEFPDAFKKQIVILDVPTGYLVRDDPQLVEVLKEKLRSYIK